MNQGKKKMPKMKTIIRIIALFLVLFTFPANSVFAGDMGGINSKALTQKTITVTSPNIQTAQKIHSYLMAGTSITLKIQNKNAANKFVSTLQGKMKSVNKQGVIFQHGKATRKGRYCFYDISKDDARLYQYSVRINL